MRFYELQYSIKSHSEWAGALVFDFKRDWFSSKRKAVQFRQALYRSGCLSGRRKDAVIFVHEIPTSRDGLLEWLNTQGVCLGKRKDGGF